MPLYEYYCEACDGSFELLRPAREASAAQPCPVCDEDAKRIISHEWSAFTFREGYARRLPDDGGYYHLGKKVTSGISRSIDGYSHPEIDRPEPTAAPTIEEIEHYEHLQEWTAKETDVEARAHVIDQNMRDASDMKERMLKTRGSRAEEAAKRRALATERQAKKNVTKD